MSRRKSSSAYSLTALALLLSAPANASSAGEAPAGMGLRAIIEAAIAQNRGLAAKQLAADALAAERRATAGNFGPVLRAEVSGMLWDSNNVYDFDTSGFEALFAQIGAPPGLEVPPMRVLVRDDLTLQAKVMVIQPLAQLWQIAHGYSARSHAATAGEYDALSERRNLEEKVVHAFFGHLGAAKMLASVTQAEKQIAAIEKQTHDYVQNGLLERDALLKVQVQREELAKNRFAAEKGIALTRATLNMLMGRQLDAPLTVVCQSCDGREDAAALSAYSRDRLGVLQQRAAEERPELGSARAQLAAARAAEDAEFGKLLPELNLVGAFIHNEGMGDFMLENEFFAGLVLEWNFWDWGATYYKARAAALRAEQAAARVAAAEDGMRLQVHQRLLELDEARKRLTVAEAALRLAEENLRLEQNKYSVQQTAAADLLSAQTSELRSRIDRTVAAMQVEMARRGLQLASGLDLLDLRAPQAKENVQEIQP